MTSVVTKVRQVFLVSTGETLSHLLNCLVDTGAAISVVDWDFLQGSSAGRKLAMAKPHSQ